MQRVERHIIIGNSKLDELCFKSKNLYNYANYLIRQEFTQNGKMLSEAEEVGIKVVITEESYTSKTDHYSGEEMRHHDNYMGRRVKRGLFRSATGKLVNADLNGAIGILRKVSHENYMQVVGRGGVATPSRILV